MSVTVLPLRHISHIQTTHIHFSNSYAVIRGTILKTLLHIDMYSRALARSVYEVRQKRLEGHAAYHQISFFESDYSDSHVGGKLKQFGAL